jgi:hypothetical protein
MKALGKFEAVLGMLLSIYSRDRRGNIFVINPMDKAPDPLLPELHF